MAVLAGGVITAQYMLRCRINSERFDYELTEGEGSKIILAWKDKQAVLPGLTPMPTPELAPPESSQDFNLAVAAVNQGDWPVAEQRLAGLLAGGSPPMLANYLHGIALRRLGRPAEAATAYNAYLALSPTSKFKYSAAVELAYLLLPEKNFGAQKAEKACGPILEGYATIADPRIRTLAIQGLRAIYKGRAIEEDRKGNKAAAAEYQSRLKGLIKPAP